MLYSVLADIVVVTHFLWIVFLVTGAWWAVRSRPVMIVHAAGLSFAVVSQVFGWYCPLTHLEVWLRGLHDPSLAYPGSFIAYYTEKLVYFTVPGSAIFVLTIALVAMNILIYVRAYRHEGERERKEKWG